MVIFINKQVSRVLQADVTGDAENKTVKPEFLINPRARAVPRVAVGKIVFISVHMEAMPLMSTAF